MYRSLSIYLCIYIHVYICIRISVYLSMYLYLAISNRIELRQQQGQSRCHVAGARRLDNDKEKGP